MRSIYVINIPSMCDLSISLLMSYCNHLAHNCANWIGKTIYIIILRMLCHVIKLWQHIIFIIVTDQVHFTLKY